MRREGVCGEPSTEVHLGVGVLGVRTLGPCGSSCCGRVAVVLDNDAAEEAAEALAVVDGVLGGDLLPAAGEDLLEGALDLLARVEGLEDVDDAEEEDLRLAVREVRRRKAALVAAERRVRDHVVLRDRVAQLLLLRQPAPLHANQHAVVHDVVLLQKLRVVLNRVHQQRPPRRRQSERVSRAFLQVNVLQHFIQTSLFFFCRFSVLCVCV